MSLIEIEAYVVDVRHGVIKGVEDSCQTIAAAAQFKSRVKKHILQKSWRFEKKPDLSGFLKITSFFMA
jgi:hypothetical protein